MKIHTIELVIGALIVALLVAVTFVAANDNSKEEWERFKADRQCRVVAHVRGQSMPTFGVYANGGLVTGVTATGNQTGWLCNDGITYYR